MDKLKSDTISAKTCGGAITVESDINAEGKSITAQKFAGQGTLKAGQRPRPCPAVAASLWGPSGTVERLRQGQMQGCGGEAVRRALDRDQSFLSGILQSVLR